VPGPPELAIGDSASDLSLLERARRGIMLGHARESVGVGVQVTKHKYQRGLLEAVDGFLGHSSNRCDLCHSAEMLSPGATLVSALLLGLEGGLRVALESTPAILSAARNLQRLRRSGRRP
jgi:hypothetical protein